MEIDAHQALSPHPPALPLRCLHLNGLGVLWYVVVIHGSIGETRGSSYLSLITHRIQALMRAL